MRYILCAIMLACTCLLGATAASAGRVTGDCWTAARLGGPCGCEAAKLVGRGGDRSLWAVSSWHRFPRAAAAPGMAAIWPGRHVEIITAVHGDGTVSTTGSVGFSRVSLARLVVVNPHGGMASAPVRYAYHGRSHARYAARYHHRYAVRAVVRYAARHRMYAMADTGHNGPWR